MKEILAKQVQKLLSVLVSYSQDTSEIPQQSSETLSATWFEELKAKVESGEIPKFRGKWHDGNPVDFLLSHYKEVVDARILTQAHLRVLDKKLLDSVRHACKDVEEDLIKLLPSAVGFSKKMI